MSKPKTLAQLKKILDKTFSEYVRRNDADHGGYASCYTCGQTKPWKQLQAGHYISRQYLATRWDVNNVKSQCVGCNLFGHGKPLDFEERLKKELGEDAVEEMKKKRHLTLKLDRQWYLSKIEHYENLLTKL